MGMRHEHGKISSISSLSSSVSDGLGTREMGSRPSFMSAIQREGETHGGGRYRY